MPEHTLSPEQVAVLRGASPAELQAMVAFGRNYVQGAWILCLIARSIVGVGAIAGAGVSVFTLLKSIGWIKGFS